MVRETHLASARNRQTQPFLPSSFVRIGLKTSEMRDGDKQVGEPAPPSLIELRQVQGRPLPYRSVESPVRLFPGALRSITRHGLRDSSPSNLPCPSASFSAARRRSLPCIFRAMEPSMLCSQLN